MWLRDRGSADRDRPAEVEAGHLRHLAGRMAGVDRGQAKTLSLLGEGEDAASGDQRVGPAGAIDVRLAAARRADEIDLWHQHPRRVFSRNAKTLAHSNKRLADYPAL
mgnify:CR=1 FL=1